MGRLWLLVLHDGRCALWQRKGDLREAARKMDAERRGKKEESKERRRRWRLKE